MFHLPSFRTISRLTMFILNVYYDKNLRVINIEGHVSVYEQRFYKSWML